MAPWVIGGDVWVTGWLLQGSGGHDDGGEGQGGSLLVSDTIFPVPHQQWVSFMYRQDHRPPAHHHSLLSPPLKVW